MKPLDPVGDGDDLDRNGNGKPRANGANGRLPGRAPDGKFAKGNAFAQGNPLAAKVQQLRRVLLDVVTVKDLEKVCRKLITLAKAGDLVAIRELMDRLFGKSKTAIELTGADGEPLGVSMAALQGAVLEALADHPDARLKVAAKLKSISANE